MTRICDICHRDIEKLADHDPAHHVAEAYHVAGPDWRCISCDEHWPCPTRKQYGSKL